MILYKLEVSSVTVVWIIVEEVVDMLRISITQLIDTNDSDFVNRYKIVHLVLDDCTLYPHNCVEQYFCNACREGIVDVVREHLRDTIADPNYFCEVLGLSMLMCAANYGHLNILDLLIDFEANLDLQDKSGRTALSIASQTSQISPQNREDIVKFLLEKGADPNIQENNRGMCPLLIATEKGDTDVAKLCLNYPTVDLNIANNDGKTVLFLAIEGNNVELVKAFLHEDVAERVSIEHHDVLGRTAIHAAVERGNLEILRHLIETFPEARDLEDLDGNKPVDSAIRRGDQEMVTLLGLEGEDETESLEGEEAGPSHGRREGEEEPGRLQRMRSSVFQFFKQFRPIDIKLMRASKSGNHAKVKKLLGKGADPDTKEIDSLQWTPLMWASHRGYLETVEVLLEHKADPNIQATNGYTALILASRKGNHEIVKMLLDPTNPIQAKVDMQNKTRGWSALMWASQTRGAKRFTSEEAKENRRKVVEHLLAAGASMDLETKNGWTPLMQASQDGEVELVRLFCSRLSPKDINHQSKSTWSALTTACRKFKEKSIPQKVESGKPEGEQLEGKAKDYTEIVRLLVGAGADVNQTKKGGVTALHIASYKGMLGAIEVMVSQAAMIDVQDSWGMTPLILATKQNHQELMDYLIQAGADVNIKAQKYAQWSAIFFALKNGNEKTAKLLMDNDANMEITDKYGHNPLSYSKGLFVGKKIKIYKYLVSIMYPPDDAEHEVPTHQKKTTKREELDRKDFTPADGAVYTSTEAFWRATQLPNLVLNFDLLN